MVKTTLYNLYGSPGSGKTTASYEMAYRLKKTGKTVALAQEYATDLIFAGKLNLSTQVEVCVEQLRRITLPIGHVDFVVTDAPLYMNIVYADKYEKPVLERLINRLYDHFTFEERNIFFPLKEERWSAKNRVHTLEECRELEEEILLMGLDYNLAFEDYETVLSEVGKGEDGRKLALKRSLRQLSTEQLQRILNYTGEMCLDDANYRDGEFCPLAVAFGLDDMINPTDEKVSLAIARAGLNPRNMKGVPGEFYRDNRKDDLLIAVSEVLAEAQLRRTGKEGRL